MLQITAKWTIAEYHLMIASGILDERRVELLKGEIVEMPLEGEPHAYFSSEAGEYLMALLGDRATIRLSKPITLPNHSELVFNLLFPILKPFLRGFKSFLHDRLNFLRIGFFTPH